MTKAKQPAFYRGKFVIQPGEVYEIDGADYEILTAVSGMHGMGAGSIALGALTYVIENKATGERSGVSERALQANLRRNRND